MSSKASSDSWTGPPKWPEDAEIKGYAGGCHCKKFRFKFTHPIFENGGMKVTTCNCSICNQHGLYNMSVDPLQELGAADAAPQLRATIPV